MLMYQFTCCTMAGWYTVVPVSISQEPAKDLQFALASHGSLFLFISFHFEMYMIESECSEKKETCFFIIFIFLFLTSHPKSTYFLLYYLFIYLFIYLFFFADWTSITRPDGNIRSAYTYRLKVKNSAKSKLNQVSFR